MFKNILLPTDGTEYSDRAIARCIEFAQSIGAKVTGFHAEREYPLLAYGAYAEVGDVDTAPPSHEGYDKGEEISGEEIPGVDRSRGQGGGGAVRMLLPPRSASVGGHHQGRRGEGLRPHLHGLPRRERPGRPADRV